MKLFHHIFVLLACSACFFGCDRTDVVGSAYNTDVDCSIGITNRYENLSDDAVLLACDGARLLKRDFEAQVRARLEVFKKLKPSLAKMDENVLVSKLRPRMFAQSIPKMLYLVDAKSNSISATDADFKEVYSRYGRSHGFRSFWAVSNKLSRVELKIVTQEITDEALILAYFRFRAPNAFIVTEKEVTNLRQHVDDLNKKSATIAQQQRDKAWMIFRKLKEGQDFNALAKEYSSTIEDDAHTGEWGVFELSEIPYPEVREVVARLNVHEYSTPLELDDGIHIVRLDEKIGEGAPSVFNEDGERFKLSRIVVNLPMEYEVGTQDEIQIGLRNERLARLQTKWLRDLQLKYKKRFPSGVIQWK